MSDIPIGLCQCGCGKKTDISKKSNRYFGYVKDEPFRFIRGHQSRRTPIDFVVEDRGYETYCWIWQRSTDSSGYASKKIEGRTRTVFRYLAERIYGAIPQGFEPDHLCRVRTCIRPDHLEVVTRAVNVQRGKSAKLTPSAVIAIRGATADGVSYRTLARRYGLKSKSTIAFICHGATWKNVAKEVA